MARKPEWKKTEESIVLNGVTYPVYIDETLNYDHKYIKINDEFYPPMSELQEKFHRIYKPILRKPILIGVLTFTAIIGGYEMGKACYTPSSVDGTINKNLEKIIEP